MKRAAISAEARLWALGWTPGTLAARSLEILRREGARGLLTKVVGETVYRRLRVLERRLEEPLPDVSCAFALRFEELSPDGIEEYLDYRAAAFDEPLRDLFREEVVRRLQEGACCYLARHEGRLAASTWVSTGPARLAYLDMEVHPAAGEAYVHDGFTDEALRGKGISPALARWMLERARERGLVLLWTAVLPENLANLRARAKAGFRPRGEVGCLRLGSWRRAVRRPDGDASAGTGLEDRFRLVRAEDGTAPRLGLDDPRRYFELASWSGDRSLRLAVVRCVEASRRAALAARRDFRPDPGAREHVSSSALERLLASGDDVHGIAREREVGDAIPFNARHVSGSVLDARVARLRRRVDRLVRRRLRREFGPRIDVVNSGHFWYPPGAFMGWHTNSQAPGWRLYVTVATEPGRSFFRYRDPETGAIHTSTDRRWDVRVFRVTRDDPLWHAVHSDTDRFSFGYLVRPFSLADRFRHLARRLRRRLGRS